MKTNQPIIIKKVNKGGHKHHGGSWKVAFADFAIAMMAFFMVMWLANSATPQQKHYIAGHFKDPGGALIGPGGADSALIPLEAPKGEKEKESKDLPSAPQGDVLQQAAELEKKRLQILANRLNKMVEENSAFQDIKEQIHVDIVPEGVRVQIFDEENRPMFLGGQAQVQPFARLILQKFATVIAKVPNKVSVTGHTDGIPYAGRPNYTNWELSTDRANAARRQLVAGGLPVDQIAKVEGLADSLLLDQRDPNNPINRRINIIVLKKSASDAIEQSALATELQDIADEVNKELPDN